VCVCVVQRQPNNVPIRSWLYIEGHLSRRRTLNWRHQPQFWYEIVVPWNGKGNGHRVVRVAFQVCFL